MSSECPDFPFKIKLIVNTTDPENHLLYATFEKKKKKKKDLPISEIFLYEALC